MLYSTVVSRNETRNIKPVKHERRLIQNTKHNYNDKKQKHKSIFEFRVLVIVVVTATPLRKRVTSSFPKPPEQQEVDS